MARPRLEKNKSLPPNLYWNNSRFIYRYRRPDTGKFTYIGKDRGKAIAAVKKLNSLLMEGEELVAKVMSESKRYNNTLTNVLFLLLCQNAILKITR